ncbi:hypothetical protein JCM33374_g5436 [Metschnikowia sp. JCM 33374]|nr:hypothetical protein JCM33374_g5436 [Metschnikowia sp. JCM 33374]
MDVSMLHTLQSLLRLPGSQGASLVYDTSVLSCGCLVSEQQFLSNSSRLCPSCHEEEVHVLKPVVPMRSLYGILKEFESSLIEEGDGLKKTTRANVISIASPDIVPREPLRGKSKSVSKTSASPPDLDLLGLFCKFAKEEQEENTVLKGIPEDALVIPDIPSDISIGPRGDSVVSLNSEIQPHNVIPTRKKAHSSYVAKEEKLVSGLDENEERNFSQCFPFHRKITSFSTQSGKMSFSSRSLMKKISRFTGSAICTRFDLASKTERTHFVLISDKKWELYVYTSTKPTLLACGRSTGAFGPSYSALELPTDDGLIVHNDFADKKSQSGKPVERAELVTRLKSWVQLHCCLSEKYLVISGTKGIMRVLNVDPSWGLIGQPVYTYIIDFPIRCIALAPNDGLIACGITTKEKMTGKQQPFVILHQIKDNKEDKNTHIEKNNPISVTPITITVPYRDPLKILNFNASSTHLVCCTIYEMRYFIIRLCDERNIDYKKPRLIFSDTRLARKTKSGRNNGIDENADAVGNLLGTEDDDHMLDNEGITDIKFGKPFTNTIVVTSSSLKNKPSVVLKINGPSLDSRRTHRRPSSGEFYHDKGKSAEVNTSEDEDAVTTTDVEVLMKVSEIGSNIYGAEVSPRGDSIIFVDKSGRLLLAATRMGYRSIKTSEQIRNTVVLLGEVSPALRYTECASVSFSSDGGKVMAIDRKGIFQVFDFTKGAPGEDPEVIKCKIISVR